MALICGGLATLPSAAQKSSLAVLAHTRREFTLVVNAPFEKATPLFGAHEERKWAPGWDPQFVYPSTAADRQGSIFQVKHGQNTSVWTTTAFDLSAGHIQ